MRPHTYFVVTTQVQFLGDNNYFGTDYYTAQKSVVS